MKTTAVEKNGVKLELLSDNLKYRVTADGFAWISRGRRTYIVFQKKTFGKYLPVLTRFARARSIEHSVEGDALVSRYTGFRLGGRVLPVAFVVRAEILDDGRIDFSLEAQNEEGTYLKAVYFPQPFNAAKYKKNDSYTVDPMRQGFILPDNWKQNRKQIFLTTKYWRKINTGDAYLGLWGRVCGSHGYSAVIEDSSDCSLFSCYDKRRAFLTSANWYSSLGELSYKRVVHFRFSDECDYVKIAKDFRANEIRKGELVTIDEKISANPKVAKLAGAPIVHWRIMENNVPTSGIYKKTKIGETLHNTFGQTEEKFRRFKKLGLDGAYVHTDGWGKRGYDNLHPYVLPPCERAGGYDGMKRLSETCGELGYMFGLHDQYRDFYQDSEVYDEKKCVHDVNMKKSYCDYWSGGAHNWLDSTLAKPFVERTYSELAEHGVNVDGTYLDVWGIMWGDENYNPDHRVTRKQSVEARGECFDMLRRQGLVVSSEEIGCNMVKYLDLVHHAPYAVTPQGGGVQVGVPVPLANLVYHDCVFVPWHCEGTGGWGIPDGDAGKLHCVLNGQNPYFNNSMANMADESESELAERIARTMEIAAVNGLVYNREMVSHKFLDKNYRVQQTEFSGGVKITVDFDKNTYTVEK